MFCCWMTKESCAIRAIQAPWMKKNWRPCCRKRPSSQALSKLGGIRAGFEFGQSFLNYFHMLRNFKERFIDFVLKLFVAQGRNRRMNAHQLGDHTLAGLPDLSDRCGGVHAFEFHAPGVGCPARILRALDLKFGVWDFPGI